MTIVVAGEALVDLAPRGQQLLPLPGGSPYNVAVGLGRLQRPTAYLGRLSSDGFGQRLRDRLLQEGVELDLAMATDDPTTLAVVHLDEQARASYRFYLQGTSAAGLPDPLPTLPSRAAVHVSFGAIGLAHPAGDALGALLRSRARGHVTSLDPNVRPSAVSDPPAYVARLEELVTDVTLVKVSDEDLQLLYPDQDPMAIAADWAARGPALVVVTRGPDGAAALTGTGRYEEVPGRPVDVVDTVGAGDAFTSGLLAWLDAHGRLDDRDALRDLADDGDVAAALTQAVTVAAITCTRAGSDPPTREELASWTS